MAKGKSNYTSGNIRQLAVRNIGQQVEFAMTGDWDKAEKFIRNLPVDVMKAVFAAEQVFAKQYYKALRKNLNEHGARLGWAPVSKKYATYKRSQAAKGNTSFSPSEIGFFNAQMYKAIEIKTQMSKMTVSVGISKGKEFGPSKPGGYTTSQIATIFERGSSRGQKPRPLFGPVFQQMGGRTKLRTMVFAGIGLELKRKYNITPM